MLIAIGFFFIFLLWSFKEWENKYFLGDEEIDSRVYGEFNIFKAPFRKIYRPPRYGTMEYDIFLLSSVNRFTKVAKYKLVDVDDQPEVLKSIKENSNGKGNS